MLLRSTKFKGALPPADHRYGVRAYPQLFQEQRFKIYALQTLRYALLNAGHKQSEIAHLIKVHKSKITREFIRNRGLKGYPPKQAHQYALNRCNKAMHRIDASTRIFIETLIRKKWSTEHVSDWLEDNYGLQISYEWIYQYILMDKHAGGHLHRHLRCQSKILTREKTQEALRELTIGVKSSKTG